MVGGAPKNPAAWIKANFTRPYAGGPTFSSRVKINQEGIIDTYCPAWHPHAKRIVLRTSVIRPLLDSTLFAQLSKVSKIHVAIWA